tara:strand:+ start:2617 stop:2889 length:273 start_codon:yes stop_codon:yes gene_type:complete
MTNLTNDGKIDGDAAGKLKSLISEVERLEEQKRQISDNIKELFDEAKSFGFDVKIIRQILKIRKIDDESLQEQEYLIEVYKDALGMGEKT